MENPIKMDDLGVPPFTETPICHNDGDVIGFESPWRKSMSLDPSSEFASFGTGGSYDVSVKHHKNLSFEWSSKCEWFVL